eukprot:2187717-Amphidinium_carterae.1
MLHTLSQTSQSQGRMHSNSCKTSIPKCTRQCCNHMRSTVHLGFKSVVLRAPTNTCDQLLSTFSCVIRTRRLPQHGTLPSNVLQVQIVHSPVPNACKTGTVPLKAPSNENLILDLSRVWAKSCPPLATTSPVAPFASASPWRIERRRRQWRRRAPPQRREFCIPTPFKTE